MREGLLTKQELDALMDLFDTTPCVSVTEEAATGDGDIGALQAQLETEAARWAKVLGSLTEQTATVSLRSIVRHSGVGTDKTSVFYRCYDKQEASARFLLCPEALVNLVNEKSLGARDTPPMLSHALSEIDKALFETTGGFFSENGVVSYVEKLPDASAWLEARFEVRAVREMHMILRLLIDEKSL